MILLQSYIFVGKIPNSPAVLLTDQLMLQKDRFSGCVFRSGYSNCQGDATV